MLRQFDGTRAEHAAQVRGRDTPSLGHQLPWPPSDLLPAPLCSADRPRPQVLRIPTAPADQLPECTAEKGPSMVATMNADLGMEVVQMCMDKGGTAQWRPVVTSGGVIYDGAPCFGCPLCRRCC